MDLSNLAVQGERQRVRRAVDGVVRAGPGADAQQRLRAVVALEPGWEAFERDGEVRRAQAHGPRLSHLFEPSPRRRNAQEVRGGSAGNHYTGFAR